LVTEAELNALIDARVRQKLEEMSDPLRALTDEMAQCNREWREFYKFMNEQLMELNKWRKQVEIEKRGRPKNFRDVMDGASLGKPDRPEW
jgi:phage shock protein A